MERTIIEGTTLIIDRKTKVTPYGKVMAGRLDVDDEGEINHFKEEDDAKIIFGLQKSKPVMRGNMCSVWWNPEKQRYTIRIQVDPKQEPLFPRNRFEDCMNFLGRRIKNV